MIQSLRNCDVDFSRRIALVIYCQLCIYEFNEILPPKGAERWPISFANGRPLLATTDRLHL